MKTHWQYFPKHSTAPSFLVDVVQAFKDCADAIETPANQFSSNEVLESVADGLESVGYQVERGKGKSQKISRPVLYGKNGNIEKSFEVDAWDSVNRVVLEVEAGRGVVNHQFLKDFFEACVIQDADYLVIAVCKGYQPPSYKHPVNDFETVSTFMDTLYSSMRMELPLKGVMIIGY
jgi:hypothetical protein